MASAAPLLVLSCSLLMAFTHSYLFTKSWNYGKYHHINKNHENIIKRFAQEGPTLWSEQVDYLDLATCEAGDPSKTRQLPLFLLNGAFFPEGITFLNIFEMRYR
jgi:hypothetical protein